MKRFKTSLLFGLIVMPTIAQTSLSVLTNEKVIGNNYINSNDLIAKEYLFPERIDHSYIDTTTHFLTVQLRGTSKNGKWLNNTGNIVLYDLANKRIKWNKKINYQQENIEQTDNIIIQTISNKSYCLNIENGSNQWEVKNALYYIDPFHRIGIGYKIKFSTGYTNTLEGIDLTNGNLIWNREISREYGWNNIFHLTDSMLIIVASGLHTINLNNGKGWDYTTITGEKDYTATAIADAAGLALGVLTGTFAMATGHNLIRDVVSNVLLDSSDIYFASREKIVRIDRNGQIKWTSVLPKDLVSKSTIFMKDSFLYMINKGYAFMGYRQLDYGTSFIAAYNKENGKQVYLNTTNSKKNQIKDFKISKNDALILYKDKILKYSLINGNFQLEKKYAIDSLGELNYFVGRQVYLRQDTIYKSLEFLDSTKNYVFTKKGKIITINDDLEIQRVIDYDQIFIYYLKNKNLRFLAKGDSSLIINKMGVRVAEIKASNNSVLLGSKLYDIQEKSFIEIDINDLIKTNAP